MRGRTREWPLAPAYPDILRSANVDGVVRFRVRIDASGRPDLATFRADSSDHELFTAAVKRTLRTWRWRPPLLARLTRRSTVVTHTVQWRLLPADTVGGSPDVGALCPPHAGATTFVCARPTLIRRRVSATQMVSALPSPSGPFPRRRGRAERDSALAELARNRARWAAAGITRYRYRVTTSGGWQGQRTRLVQIVAGHAQDGGLTVGELFARGEVAIRDTTIEVAVISYDPRYGFPTRVAIDPSVGTMDDDSDVAADEFRPARR